MHNHGDDEAVLTALLRRPDVHLLECLRPDGLDPLYLKVTLQQMPIHAQSVSVGDLHAKANCLLKCPATEPYIFPEHYFAVCSASSLSSSFMSTCKDRGAILSLETLLRVAIVRPLSAGLIISSADETTSGFHVVYHLIQTANSLYEE